MVPEVGSQRWWGDAEVAWRKVLEEAGRARLRCRRASEEAGEAQFWAEEERRYGFLGWQFWQVMERKEGGDGAAMGTAMVERLLRRAAGCMRRLWKAMEADIAASERLARLPTSEVAQQREAAAAAVRRVDAAIQRDKERAETMWPRLRAIRLAESLGEPRVLLRLVESEPAEWWLGVTWQVRREMEERSGA